MKLLMRCFREAEAERNIWKGLSEEEKLERLHHIRENDVYKIEELREDFDCFKSEINFKKQKRLKAARNVSWFVIYTFAIYGLITLIRSLV